MGFESSFSDDSSRRRRLQHIANTTTLSSATIETLAWCFQFQLANHTTLPFPFPNLQCSVSPVQELVGPTQPADVTLQNFLHYLLHDVAMQKGFSRHDVTQRTHSGFAHASLTLGASTSTASTRASSRCWQPAPRLAFMVSCNATLDGRGTMSSCKALLMLNNWNLVGASP